jgi:uncharacterized protein (DUF342 family)
MDVNTVNQTIGELNISVESSKLKAYVNISYLIQGKDNSKCSDTAASNNNIYSEIEKALAAKRIVYGILYENFKEAIKGNNNVLIAQGTSPLDPVDDKIEYYFPVTQERKIYEIDGKIDFLNSGSIFFVKEGTLLAKVIEGKDGAPGKDVFGEIIPAPRKARGRLKRGPNCEYTPDKLGVVSKISGMPSLKNDMITVFNTYNLNNDVDCKTGNIVFDGNILINGNVKEGMKVFSRGSIIVSNNVDSSELKADGNITIMKNLICSVIKAGATEVPDQTALMYLKEITAFFSSFTNAVNDLLRNIDLSKNNSSNSIIKAVLQLKFKDIHQTINTISAYSKSIKADSSFSVLFTESIRLYKLLEAGILTNVDLLLKQALRNTDYIEGYESVFSSSNVMVNSCQNSTIYATNDVMVSGKGCYNTNIFANNNVKFSGHPGIFRGGSISAGKNISVGELGSTAEVYTVVRTSKEGIVTAEKVYPNVLLYFENMVYRVEDSYKNFKAYIKDREIMVEKQML